MFWRILSGFFGIGPSTDPVLDRVGQKFDLNAVDFSNSLYAFSFNNFEFEGVHKPSFDLIAINKEIQDE